MNRVYRRIPIVLLALFVIAACASAPPDRVALSTLQGLKVTADAAMRTCASAYAAGQLTEQQKAEAIAAYDAFASAEIAGAFAIQGAKTQVEIDAITTNVSKSLTALLNLLRSLGVKGL